MYNSIEDVPEYLCDQCSICTYFELGYCPYVDAYLHEEVSHD